MKMTLRVIQSLVCVAVFACCGVAQAVTFTISDVMFSALNGNNERFRWSVASAPVSPFDLAVGGSTTFTYGTFYTNDFPINPQAGNDNDDSFLSQFSIMPPDPALTASRTGIPDAAHAQTQNGSAWVDFNNAPIDLTFGNTGEYTVTFLDTGILTSDGSIGLRATIHLISDVTTTPPTPDPVIPPGNDPPPNNDPQPIPNPEPGTLLLLGSGLIGLGIFGRKRMKK
jgi:PEP-CTERM motif